MTTYSAKCIVDNLNLAVIFIQANSKAKNSLKHQKHFPLFTNLSHHLEKQALNFSDYDNQGVGVIHRP